MSFHFVRFHSQRYIFGPQPTDLGGIDDRVAALDTRKGGILKHTSEGVEGAGFFLSIRETYTILEIITHDMSIAFHTSAERLRKEQHVRDLVPRVRVYHGLILLVDAARTQL